MDDNPYMVSSSVQKDTPVAVQDGAASGEMVGKGRRFATYILDTVFTYVLAMIFGVILALIGYEHLIDRIPNLLFGVILWLFYYVPQEAVFGRTVAKAILGTKVVSNDGGDVTFFQVLGRTICRFIPFEPFSYLGETPLGWHDTLSKTKVIYTR